MATKDPLLAKVCRFLANQNTRPEDLLALTAFVEARPAYSEPTSYISDVEQRLELLQEIRQKCEQAKYDIGLTAALWSVLMIIPLEQLRSLRDRPFLVGSLEGILSNIPMLLKVCMLPLLLYIFDANVK
jgi:hypothetical protein